MVEQTRFEDSYPIPIVPGPGDWKPMMEPLKKVLQEITKNQDKISDNEAKAEAKRNKTLDQQHAELIQVYEDLNSIEEFILNQTKDISKEQKKQGQENKTMREYLKDLVTKTDDNGKKQHKVLNFIYTTGVVLKDIYDVSKKVLESFNESNFFINEKIAEALRSNGVVLNNFDENFNRLADESGRTREEFVQRLTENSQFIASQYAVGKNGTEIVAGQLKKVSAKFGMTLEESDKAVKSFNDSMMSAGNQANIANIDYENELYKSTSALKSFALATGQSVEAILKEQKLREKSWQMQRLATDPRTRNQFLMMRNAGLSDDMIEAIMLNKVNKASVMATLDPNSAMMLSGMRRAYMTTKGNPEAFAQAMMGLSNSRAAEGMRRTQALTNPESLAYVNGLGELFDPASQWGMLTSMHMRRDNLMETTDAKAIDETNKHVMKVNQINNDMINAMAPSLQTIAEDLPTISKTLTWLPEQMAKVMNIPIISKSLTAISTTLQTIEPALNSKTMQMIMQKFTGSDVDEEDEDGGKKSSSKDGASTKELNNFFTKGRGLSLMLLGAGSAAGLLGYFTKESWLLRGGFTLAGAGIGGSITGGWKGAALGGILGYFSTGDLVDRLLGKEKTNDKGPAVSSVETTAFNFGNQNTNYNNPITAQSARLSALDIGSILKNDIVDILKDSNDTLKNMYSEFRTGGFKLGTNFTTT